MAHHHLKTLVVLLVVVGITIDIAAVAVGIGGVDRAEHIVDIFVEDIKLEAQETAPQGGVHTSVVLEGFGPGEVDIGRTTGEKPALGHSTDDHRRTGQEGERIQVIVRRNFRGASQTDTPPQFEVVDVRYRLFEPLLIGDPPAQRARRKRTPPFALDHPAEDITAVVAEREFREVFVVEVVVKASQETCRALLIAAPRHIVLLLQLGKTQLVELRDVKAVTIGAEEVAVALNGLHQPEEFQVVQAEFVDIFHAAVGGQVGVVTQSLDQTGRGAAGIVSLHIADIARGRRGGRGHPGIIRR